MRRLCPLLSLLLAAVVTASLCAGCAAGGDEDLADSGQGSDTDTPDDTGRPDTGADDTGPADTATDSEPADACGACCPGETTCVDETTAGVCRADGTGFDETACADGEHCVSGACEVAPVCQPGESRCHDGQTRLYCNPRQDGWRQESCAAGTSCVAGECVAGNPTGASCAAAADCAGDRCRCGADETCTHTGDAYCTTTCTADSDCGPDSFCVDAGVFADAGYNHCVPACDTTCPIDGLRCVTLPAADSSGPAWRQGCTFEATVALAESCASDAGCVGGECLSGYYGSQDVCTHPCQPGGCPDGFACVDLGGTQRCAYKCQQETDCPMYDGDSFTVSCGTRTAGASAYKVCVEG